MASSDLPSRKLTGGRSSLSTQLWIRNPDLCIRECAEQRVDLIAWDRGLLVKHQIDPIKLVELYYPSDLDYRMLLIGQQGAAELQRGRDVTNPVAVYPVWEYGMSIDILDQIMSEPIASDPTMTGDQNLLPDERPVVGQEHRVVIIGLPSLQTGPGREIIKILDRMQAEYPECILHIHGLYSYRHMFGHGFGAVDMDPRTSARKGKVYLPNGKEVSREMATVQPQWITLCGYLPSDLKVARKRCMYNIRSARWAAEHWEENFKFRSKGTNPPGPDDPVRKTVHRVWSRRRVMIDSDRILCNGCSQHLSCKYYRDGGVCSIPGSEPADLVKLFGTRDADVIIDGLNVLLADGARRYQEARLAEDSDNVINPEATKMLNTLFDRGVKLAKLLDPALRSAGGPATSQNVNVLVNGANAAVQAASPREFVSAIVKALKAEGFKADEITPDLIARLVDPNSKEVILARARELGQARRA